LISLWDEVVQSILEFGGKYEGCGSLLLLKLMKTVVSWGVFEATFSQNHLWQRQSSVSVIIPLYSIAKKSFLSCIYHIIWGG